MSLRGSRRCGGCSCRLTRVLGPSLGLVKGTTCSCFRRDHHHVDTWCFTPYTLYRPMLPRYSHFSQITLFLVPKPQRRKPPGDPRISNGVRDFFLSMLNIFALYGRAVFSSQYVVSTLRLVATSGKVLQCFAGITCKVSKIGNALSRE